VRDFAKASYQDCSAVLGKGTDRLAPYGASGETATSDAVTAISPVSIGFSAKV